MYTLKEIFEAKIYNTAPEVMEMAKLSKYNTAKGLDRKEAKELEKAFRAGEETVELDDGRSFKAVKKIEGTDLKAGMMVLATFSSSRKGAEVGEVLGFANWKTEGPVNKAKPFSNFEDWKKSYGKDIWKKAADLGSDADTVHSGLSISVDRSMSGKAVTAGSGDDKGAFYHASNKDLAERPNKSINFYRHSSSDKITFYLIEPV